VTTITFAVPPAASMIAASLTCGADTLVRMVSEA